MPPIAASAADLSTQVARLFFDRQLSKVEIASRLGISRFRVARLIEGALADGLVRIEYRDVPAEDRELAGAMEERFGLDLCAVAVEGVAGTSAGHSATDVPRLAGAVLDGLMADGDAIGIAWGSTLAAVVRCDLPRRDSALGGRAARWEFGPAGPRSRRGRVGTCPGRPPRRHLPPDLRADVRGDPALRDALLREPELASTVARFGSLDLAIVGIGAMPADSGGAASSLSGPGR